MQNILDLIPTTMKSNNNSTNNQNILEDSNSTGLKNNIIFFYIVIILLFIESIYILISSIKKGIFKQEVLTKKSHIGFDIIIKS